MLDFIITESEAKRLLLNRKAAVVLGVAGALTVGALVLRYLDLNLTEMSSVKRETLSWFGAVIAVGVLFFLVGMWLFWLKCDPSKRRGRKFWFFALLLVYGTIPYYLFVYIPVLRSSLRGENVERDLDVIPKESKRTKLIGPFGWALMVGWVLLVLYFAAGFMFPKVVFQSTSHLLGPGNTDIALKLWLVSLIIGTPVYLITLLFRAGMRRSTGALPPSPRD